jgi:hypothetical protein
MMAVSLPLFEATENRAELKRLQERREALLRRLQTLPPMSHKRVGLTYELRIVTTDMIRREAKSYREGWS